MWSAKFETFDVEVVGYGPTSKEAEKVLRRLWKIVCFQNGYDPSKIDEYREEISVHEIKPGFGLVDGIEEEVDGTKLLLDGVFTPIEKVTTKDLKNYLMRGGFR